MSHRLSATNEGLLSYGITTNPDPVQVSPASGNPAIASLVITVSNNTSKAIYCNKLTFSFPVGDLAQDLAPDSGGILVSANPSDKWQIGTTSDGVFTATPKSPSDNKITKDGLSFQIYNIQVNKQVGTFTFSIVEHSSVDNKKFSDKANSHNMAKFPYGFYVNNFAASVPMVDNGNPVTLTWSGSDLGSYTILYGTQSVDVTEVRSWTSPGITDTTTFALKASVQEQGETVDNYLYVTVIVNQPEIKCTSLTATGDIQGVGICPPNAILMQYGSIADRYDSTGLGIVGTSYEGWAICNGNNGTPDLRNRFIVGAGSNYAQGASGGNERITLSVDQMPGHNHSGSAGGGEHMHYIPTDNGGGGLGWGIARTIQCDVYAHGDKWANANSYGETLSDPYSWSNQPPDGGRGSHSHNLDINDTGGNGSFDNRPPYYALYYIMKMPEANS